MKIHSPSSRLLALFMAAALASIQARADDGIAANAFAAEKREQAHQALTTSQQDRVADKETGIKAPPGVLIHPVVQNSDVLVNPVPRMRATQEDYHSQQSP